MQELFSATSPATSAAFSFYGRVCHARDRKPLPAFVVDHTARGVTVSVGLAAKINSLLDRLWLLWKVIPSGAVDTAELDSEHIKINSRKTTRLPSSCFQKRRLASEPWLIPAFYDVSIHASLMRGDLTTEARLIPALHNVIYVLFEQLLGRHHQERIRPLGSIIGDEEEGAWALL